MIRPARRLVGDRGLSLVELLVAMFVTAIVLTITVTFFVQTTRVTTTANATSATSGDAANAMNAITSRLRVTAPTVLSASSTVAIDTAQPRRLVVYANIIPAPTAIVPSKVTFYVAPDGRISITSCRGAAGAGGVWAFSCDESSSTVETWPGVIVDPTGADELPLFTYNDASGNRIGGDAGLDATQISTVASITVSIKSKTAGAADASAAYLTNDVGLPNLGTKGTP